MSIKIIAIFINLLTSPNKKDIPPDASQLTSYFYDDS